MTLTRPKRRRRSPLGAWIGPRDPELYAHLLGLYLGDGSISVPEKGLPRLALYLDSQYAKSNGLAQRCIEELFPGRPVVNSPRKGCIALSVTDPGILSAFPQHGPGKKHKRGIRLADWQLEITAFCAEAFISGLINSDGSRCMNTFKSKLPSGRVAEYSYPRYFFTNYSADIRQLFIDRCELIGVRCTQSSFKNISVSHRDSVARLDEFIGPKR